MTSLEKIEQRTQLLHELKAIRYTVGVILVNLLNLSENTVKFEDGLLRKLVKLLQREEERTRKETNEKEKVSHTLLKEKEKKEKKKKEEEKVDLREKIEFNSYSLKASYIKSLIREYNTNVVTDACVVLDKLASLQGKHYAKPEPKLREICENFSMRDKLIEDYSYTSQRVRSVDYQKIDNVTDARSYIIKTPFYRRNLDPGVAYLQNKFPELKDIKCS